MRLCELKGGKKETLPKFALCLLCCSIEYTAANESDIILSGASHWASGSEKSNVKRAFRAFTQYFSLGSIDTLGSRMCSLVVKASD